MGIVQQVLWRVGGRRVREQAVSDELHAWRMVEVSNQQLGVKGMMRLRVTKPPLARKKSFATVVSIAWPGAGEAFLPSAAELARMGEFEKAIEALTGDNGFAELVLVRTGFGEREWIFYTTNQSRFMQHLNRLLAGHPPYPLRILFDADPEWEIWQQTLSGIEKKIANGPGPRPV